MRIKTRVTNLSTDAYRERLRRMSARLCKSHHVPYLDEGCFGTVYKLPAGRVLKFSKQFDEGYLAFVRRVLKWGRGNPWFPAIHSAYRVVSMADLRAGISRRRATTLVVILEALMHHGGVFAPYEVRPTDVAGWGRNFRLVEGLRSRGQDIRPCDRRAQRILNLLTAKHGTDIGGDGTSNMMLRGRQLVFTDPIY